MTWRVPIVALLLLVGIDSAVGDGATSRPASGPGDSWDTYRVVVTRNIFVPDRSRPPASRPAFTQPASQSASVGLVLTGIGQRGAEWVAFLEDSGAGKTVRASTGQALEGGQVVSVTLDGIEYEREGARRRIVIGQSLTSGATTRPTSGPTTRPAATTQDAANESGDAATDSVLERLRQRRARELKQ